MRRWAPGNKTVQIGQHIAGVIFFVATMFLIEIVSFVLAMLTFHPGPASDYSFSTLEIVLQKIGTVIILAFGFFPAGFVTPFIYGAVLYYIIARRVRRHLRFS